MLRFVSTLPQHAPVPGWPVVFRGSEAVRARYTWLVDDGWRMFRFTKFEVYGEPDEVAATIGRALGVAPRWH
jgi:hypothetical protein